MEEKIINLIEKYETENKEILKKEKHLEMFGNFTPTGIKYFCNQVFIEELKKLLINK